MSKTASKPLPSEEDPWQASFARPAGGLLPAARTPPRPRRSRRTAPSRPKGPTRWRTTWPTWRPRRTRNWPPRPGRRRGGANRRRRPDRRSDPHLLDADGRNPHAQPRAGESSLARHIQRSRKRFRHDMLATDYMLQAAVGLLENIRDGRARLDRTIEVSVINLREKRRLLKLLGPNVAHLEQPYAPQPRGLPRSPSARARPASGAERPGSGWCAGGAGPCGWWKNSPCGRGACSPPWTS